MTEDKPSQQTVSRDQVLVDDQRLTMVTKGCVYIINHGDMRNPKLVLRAAISMGLYGGFRECG